MTNKATPGASHGGRFRPSPIRHSSFVIRHSEPHLPQSLQPQHVPGFVRGGVSLDVKGALKGDHDRALRFNGTSGKVDLGPITSPRTVEVWIRTTGSKDVPAFKFKAGVMEGRVISIAEIQQLANLPSKEELISKIMFLLNAPAQRIAAAMNDLPRNMAVTVNEAIKANKFGPATGEATPSPEAAQ